MMSKKSFENISFTLATLQFNQWCKELGDLVEQSLVNSLNKDKRLADKTKQRICNDFVKEMKVHSIEQHNKRLRVE